ncbi:MAG: asparagine synthase-related protein [Nitrososphaerales archaeon]
MPDVDCIRLRELLIASVQKHLSNAILLSGGLDSSIIASIAAKFTNLTGITVAYGDAPDPPYAKIVAERYSIKHIIKNLIASDMKDAIENVIRIMQTFDPMEIRNTSVIYLSLKELKDNGFSSVMTGDGGDELFGGYNYMQKLDIHELANEFNKLWSTMRFSSLIIGEELGINVKTPYLDREFLEFAKQIPIGLKIREKDGTRYGKWILRACFEDYVTADIAWRRKMPLEEGAAVDIYAENLISIGDTDFEEKVKYHLSHDSVRLRNREHLYYYTIYRKYFGAPKWSKCESRCPDCLGCVMTDSRFCRTCGAYPIKPV